MALVFYQVYGLFQSAIHVLVTAAGTTLRDWEDGTDRYQEDGTRRSEEA